MDNFVFFYLFYFEEYVNLYNDGEFGDGDRLLLSLREKEESEVLNFLEALPGIGPKVACCVALSSLDKFELVPVGNNSNYITRR